MSYTYGLVNQRTKPEMEVLRNFNPTFPEGYTYAARAAVSIKSGQAIALDSNGRWVLANSAVHALSEIFFALKDSDASSLGGAAYDALGAALGKDPTLTDVGQGEVVGYSCMGQYVLRVGYFSTAGSPTTGDFLTIGVYNANPALSTAGMLIKTALESGLPIVGRVSEPVLTYNTQSDDGLSLENRYNSNVPAGTAVITFKTWYSPNLVDHSA